MSAILAVVLGLAVMAALWVARRAEARTARLLAATPGFRQDEDPEPWRTS